ncbi:MAG TPA: GntR family transcriptional regulator, partial [Euzebyales bacterium]|nr:GntR family transcriptional regulator [Euzebyales bacterium]
DALRRAILRGDLVAGERVPQVVWADRLGVSTTPVREALRDLATEGMVQLDAHRGACVTRLTYEQVCEIYRIRQTLEPAALRDAARLITPVTLARAERLHRALVEQTDLGRWTELHCELHDTLLGDLRSQRMLVTVTSLRDNVSAYVSAVLRRQGVVRPHGEHRDLLDAMHAHDGDRATDIALRHLASTVAVLRYDHAAQGDNSQQPVLTAS